VFCNIVSSYLTTFSHVRVFISKEELLLHFLQRFADTLQYNGKSQGTQITPLKYGFSSGQGVRVLSI
jgi:hypothetical protein